MAYLALYRTYRPQLFSDVVGQDVVVKTLQNAIAQDKISHAYLFSGPRGTGKTTVARIFAKALNCPSRMEQEPCDMCESCVQIANGTSPDVIEIDAASNSGVEEIREIRDKAKFLPSGTKYKIYIIDEVHMLTGAAFNALLKTLEEPPAHVIFILATTEPQRIIPTILSRCQRFEFKALSVSEITKKLEAVCASEHIEAEKEALESIAEASEGGLRDALTCLDQAISFGNNKVTLEEVNQVLGCMSNDKLIALASKFEQQDVTGSLELVHELLDSGKEVDKIVLGLLGFYHDLLLYKNVKSDSYSKYIFEKEEFKALASKISDDRIFYFVEILNDVLNKIKFTQTPNLYLEVALIKMTNTCDMSLNYLERISDLERQVASIEVPELGGTQAAGLSAEDEERINLNEIKLNKVISELNRLELDKFVSKVKELEDGNVSPQIVGNAQELDEIKEDMAVIKASVQTLKSRVEENAAPKNDVDTSGLEEKISRLEQRINSIPNIDVGLINETSVLVDEIEERLNALEEKANKVEPEQGKLDIVITPKEDEEVVQEQVKSEQEEAANITQSILKMEHVEKQKPLQQTLFDFGPEEAEKEEKVESEEVKEEEENEPIQDTPSEENDSFEEAFEDEIDEPQEDIVEEQQAELVEEQPEEVVEKQPEEVVEEQTEEDLVQESTNEVNSVVDEIRKLATVDLGADDYRKVEDWNGYEVYKPIYTSKASIGIPFVILVKDDEARVSSTEETLQIAQIAFEKARINKDDEETNEAIEEVQSEEKVEPQEEKVESEEVKEEEENEPIQDTPSEEVKTESYGKVVVDKFNSYDIHFVEEILRDSKTESARNDLARIRNVWTVIGNYSEPEYKGVVSTLAKGIIVACGNKEFIIVFENAVLCNQAMALSFKQKAIKVLSVYLQTTLNYIALPKDIWMEKRNEYINQYNQDKTREPHLSPINSPELFVITTDQEYKDPKDVVIDGMKHIFGDKVKIK